MKPVANVRTSSEKNIFSILFAALYLFVHFVTDFGGADVMGAQWLYAGVLDLAVIAYIIFNSKIYTQAIATIYKIKFTLLYTFFVLWAIGSFFYAINPTESLVCLGRLATTYLIFINLSILFYKQDFKWLFTVVAYIITGILLYDSLFVLSHFSQNLGEMNLDQNILSLMGNHGNKNVMAASLMIKIPFALYVLLDSKLVGKTFGSIALTLGFISLFILNTRSTFVAIILIFVLFVMYTVFTLGVKQGKKIGVQLAYFLIPLIIAYFSADQILSNAIKIQDTSSGYGLVSDRLKTINIKDNESSRIHLWLSALDYFKQHPIIGTGYGNWKLASIPYEKAYANELFVPYHSHNDFIENAAELGILGGAAFLLLFALMFLFTIKAMVDKRFEPYRFLIVISFLGITCYFVDAFLNFPAERTAMQTMFTLCAALLYAPLILVKEEENKQKGVKNKLITFIPNAYKLGALLLILPSIYIANQVFESFKVQKFVMGEINANPTLSTEEVLKITNIPNLSTSTLPIKALIARYYIRDQNFPEAIKYLRASYKDNVFIHYNDFLLTSIFAAQGRYDSTLFYAKKAFYNWPRASSYYKNIMFAAVKNKDSLEIKKAFDTSYKYSNNALTWDQYILANFELKSKPLVDLNKLADSALKMFPDSGLMKTKALINSQGGVIVPTNNYAAQGMQLYQKGSYVKAAEMYKHAIETEPANYTHYENVAICLYTAKNFNGCIPFFDKAVSFKENNTGKSEFFKAMALIALNKKDQACGALQAAKAKGYNQADQYIKSNCQ